MPSRWAFTDAAEGSGSTRAPDTVQPAQTSLEMVTTMSDIKVYGTATCADCRRSKRFLTEQGVAFDSIDVDADADGLAYVLQLQDGARRIPVIVFADGSVLVEPTDRRLAEKLGLSLIRAAG
jgi:glutaredoxin